MTWTGTDRARSLSHGVVQMKHPKPRERYARALLLLTLIHTVPVIWITPVAGGTAPTAALLAFGLASLFTFDREGMAIAMFALGPAVIYCAIGWVLAWLVAKALGKLRQPVRAPLLALTMVALLGSVYFPIYIAGSHNAARSASIIGLFEGAPGTHLLLGYWIGIHFLMIAVFAAYLLREDHPLLNYIRQRPPFLPHYLPQCLLPTTPRSSAVHWPSLAVAGLHCVLRVRFNEISAIGTSAPRSEVRPKQSPGWSSTRQRAKSDFSGCAKARNSATP